MAMEEVVMAESGVRLTPNRRFAQFLITKPAVIEIDGVAVGEARWGRPEVVSAEAGTHRLTVSFRYFWKKRAGEASIDVLVPADQTVDVQVPVTVDHHQQGVAHNVLGGRYPARRR
jgi:hypothetical protein